MNTPETIAALLGVGLYFGVLFSMIYLAIKSLNTWDYDVTFGATIVSVLMIIFGLCAWGAVA